MKQLISITVSSICLLLCLATTATAQQPRPYFSLVGGLNLTDEMVLSDLEGDYLTSLEAGFFIGGALGIDLADGFPQLGKGRLELEVGYRYNALKEVQFSTGTVYATGDLTTLSVMVNTIGEYHDASPYYTPYLGVGVGAALISMNGTSAADSPMIDDASVQLAYQVLTGISLPLSKHLSMDLGYRYFGTLDPEFTDSKDRKVDADYANHSFELGLRLAF